MIESRNKTTSYSNMMQKHSQR